MKISVKWLRELCPVQLGDDEIAGRLTMAGLEVEGRSGVHQVVCGAPNAGADTVVPFARPGAKLPNGMEIRRAKLRGVESEGMLCSQRELGLSDDHSGLMILPRETRVGAPMDEVLGFPDTILEVNVTPNRPDALSHLGIARDLSALTGVPVRAPAAKAAGS